MPLNLDGKWIKVIDRWEGADCLSCSAVIPITQGAWGWTGPNGEACYFCPGCRAWFAYLYHKLLVKGVVKAKV